MMIDTTKVTGRRALRFATLRDILADAEHLAAAEVEMLGNWSLGQVFRHLAIALNGSIDGFPFRLPLIMRLVGQLFMKRRMLTQAISPGLGWTRRWDPVKPEPTTVADGIAALRAALARYEAEPKRAPHPALGPLTPREWDQFHLRHAELHLSFARPRG